MSEIHAASATMPNRPVETPATPAPERRNTLSLQTEGIRTSWFGATPLPMGTQSRPYQPPEPLRITAKGGTEPYSFEIEPNGALPRGMILVTKTQRGVVTAQAVEGNPATVAPVPPEKSWCELSGTPEESGVFTLKVKATDSAGLIGSREYSIAIGLNLDTYYSYFDQRLTRDGLGAAFLPEEHRLCVFNLDDKDGFPLAFCEFLAYKAAQAYYKTPEQIESALKDDPGITDFRFFDSTVPMKPPPERWTTDGAPSLREIEKARYAADTQAFGFVFEGKAFIISRGTTSLRDWRTDLDSGLTDRDESKRTWFDRLKFWERKPNELTKTERFLIENLKPGRHIGFARGWGAISDQVEDWVDRLSREKGISEFVFSGHSLGGALSFVGAYEFARRGRNIFAVVTFGAPAVGKEGGASPARTDANTSAQHAETAPHVHFVDAYNAVQNGGLARRTIRLETSADAVPQVLEQLGLAHVGREWPVQLQPLPGTSTIVLRKFMIRPLLSIALFALSKFGLRSVLGSIASSKKDQNTDKEKRSKIGIQDIWRAVRTDLISYGLIFGRFAWTAVKAHGAERRYALYLSTLSYRKMREARTRNIEPVSPNAHNVYRAAMEDLDRHLRRIRGSAARKDWLSWLRTKWVWRSPRAVKSPKNEKKFANRYYGEKNMEYLF